MFQSTVQANSQNSPAHIDYSVYALCMKVVTVIYFQF